MKECVVLKFIFMINFEVRYLPFGILRKFSTIIVLQVNDIEENLYKTKKKRELKRIVLKRKI